MYDEYAKHMREFVNKNLEVMAIKDAQFNEGGIDLEDYFPCGWESCYTYINENLLRIHSLMYSGKMTKEMFEEKFGDLLNYVIISHTVMFYKQGYDENARASTVLSND